MYKIEQCNKNWKKASSPFNWEQTFKPHGKYSPLTGRSDNTNLRPVGEACGMPYLERPLNILEQKKEKLSLRRYLQITKHIKVKNSINSLTY